MHTKPTRDIRERFNGEMTNRTRQKKDKFNPSREYVSHAVDEYLKSGGKITRLVIDSSSPVANMSFGHDYLMKRARMVQTTSQRACLLPKMQVTLLGYPAPK